MLNPVFQQEPERIESSSYRLAGRKRRIVTKKTEMMYIPLLESATILHEVSLVSMCSIKDIIRHGLGL